MFGSDAIDVLTIALFYAMLTDIIGALNDGALFTSVMLTVTKTVLDRDVPEP